MANYINDPRENMVSENGLFLDWCGDDTRYYYNGSYVDLCGMSPEDYMKNWSCCNGGDNEGDSDNRTNAVVLSQTPIIDSETGKEAIEIVAMATKPVASELTVTVTVEFIDEASNEIVSENVDIIIPVGEKRGRLLFKRPSVTITNASTTPESDDSFDYVTEGNISSVIGCLFYGVYPESGSNEGITVGLENIIKEVSYLKDNVYDATVNVPYVKVDGKITDTVIKENTVDMVFALDADITDFTVTDPNGISYMEFLSDKIKTISVQAPDEKGNIVTAFYNVYRLKNEQLVNIGKVDDGEPLPFDIKIKLN